MEENMIKNKQISSTHYVVFFIPVGAESLRFMFVEKKKDTADV
jgi:ATP-dependent Zn protease